MRRAVVVAPNHVGRDLGSRRVHRSEGADRGGAVPENVPGVRLEPAQQRSGPGSAQGRPHLVLSNGDPDGAVRGEFTRVGHAIGHAAGREVTVLVEDSARGAMDHGHVVAVGNAGAGALPDHPPEGVGRERGGIEVRHFHREHERVPDSVGLGDGHRLDVLLGVRDRRDVAGADAIVQHLDSRQDASAGTRGRNRDAGGRNRAGPRVVGNGLAADPRGTLDLVRDVDAAGARVSEQRGTIDGIDPELLALEQIAAAGTGESVLANRPSVNDMVAHLLLLDHGQEIGGVVTAGREVVPRGPGSDVVGRAGSVPAEHDATGRAGLDHGEHAGLGPHAVVDAPRQTPVRVVGGLDVGRIAIEDAAVVGPAGVDGAATVHAHPGELVVHGATGRRREDLAGAPGGAEVTRDRDPDLGPIVLVETLVDVALTVGTGHQRGFVSAVAPVHGHVAEAVRRRGRLIGPREERSRKRTARTGRRRAIELELLAGLGGAHVERQVDRVDAVGGVPLPVLHRLLVRHRRQHECLAAIH